MREQFQSLLPASSCVFLKFPYFAVVRHFKPRHANFSHGRHETHIISARTFARLR